MKICAQAKISKINIKFNINQYYRVLHLIKILLNRIRFDDRNWFKNVVMKNIRLCQEISNVVWQVASKFGLSVVTVK